MGGSIGVTRNFYDNSNSVSDEEGYYSIDGMGKGLVKEEVEKLDIEYIAQHRFGIVNSSVLDVPYINRYPFNEYRYVKKLGIGKSSIVYKATSVKDEKEKFAIKEIKVSDFKRAEFEDFRYELNIMSQLSHTSVLKLYSVYDSGGPNSKFFLILEYLKGGEVLNAILRHQSYAESDVIHFAYQIASGLQYLHSRGVVHGNLIPENLVLATQKFGDRVNNHVKIVGFDSMETLQHRRNANQTTFNNSKDSSTTSNNPSNISNIDSTNRSLLIDEQFRSPELMDLYVTQNLCTSRESDMWSFGVFLYLLLSGKLPFGDGHLSPMHPISSFSESNWEKISFVAKELLCKLLHPDPQWRFTASDAKSHPWILADEKFTPDSSNQTSIETLTNAEGNQTGTDDTSLRKKHSGAVKAPKPLLTLNHNLTALEEFQRKRYFYLEGYRNQNSINSRAQSSPPETLTIYRFMSEDLSKEVNHHKLRSLTKEAKITENSAGNDEKSSANVDR